MRSSTLLLLLALGCVFCSLVCIQNVAGQASNATLLRRQWSTWTHYGPATQIRKGKNLPSKFDYVIVGGGTAGCVLANRLSADPRNKVLVIEAGTAEDDTLLTSIPTNWDMTPFSPLDWSYLNEGLEPQVNFDGGKRHVAAGRALGGTSTINTMMWVRGNRLDYDTVGWNVPGWSYGEVLPYFKKSETSPRYNDPSINGTYYHGNSGPIHVTPGGWLPVEDELLVQSANKWGLPFNPDWNGENQIGVGFHECTIDSMGRRISSYTAYLKPVLGRANLWVMDQCLAQRILFKNNKNKLRAKGVRFFDQLTGKTHEVKAKKEVIISAGAIRSPQLLMVSGIGPASELNSIGVPVLKDLPGVGQNLQDHPITTMSWASNLTKNPEGSVLDEAAFQNYAVNRTGIVASIRGRTNFFLRSDIATDPRPDGQVIAVTPGFTAFALVYLNRPHSRGWIRLHSSDVSDHPLVTVNYYQDPRDLAAMIDLMNKTVQILREPPVAVKFPYDDRYDMTDVDKLKLYILGSVEAFTVANTGSGYHFAGTCKMGTPEVDPFAVVDNRLRVSGTKGLRVVDASIMPQVVTGNTQAAVYMIAEKASDIILEDYGFLPGQKHYKTEKELKKWLKKHNK